MKRTGFSGYVYDFIADYDSTAVDDIKDINKYLRKTIILYSMYKMFRFLKKCFLLDHYFYQV